jgi:hypothetical protein
MADVFQGITNAVTAPLRFIGTARDAILDPSGREAMLQQQSIDSNDILLAQQKTKLIVDYVLQNVAPDDRPEAFKVAMPTIYNNLPESIRSKLSPEFQQKMNTGANYKQEYDKQQQAQQQAEAMGISKATSAGELSQMAGAKIMSPGTRLRVGGGGAPTDEYVAGMLSPNQTPTVKMGETNLIYELGTKVANGTATEEEKQMFKELIAPKSTTSVNVNTAEQVQPYEQQLGLVTSQLQKQGEDPNNYVVTPTYSPTGRLYPKADKKPTAGEADIKAINDLEGLQDDIDTIKSLYKPEYVGFFEGSDIANWARQTIPKTASTEQVSFIRTVQNAADKLLRARSGAQINESEFARLSKLLAQTNNSETAFTSKLDSFNQELEKAITNRQEINKQQGRLPIGRRRSQMPTQQKALTSQDKEAIDWAKKNPNDPRAKNILSINGM